MLDIRLLRDDPAAVVSRLETRGSGAGAAVSEILECDTERRQFETRLQQLKADRNRISKEIGQKKGQGEPTSELEDMVRSFSQEMAEFERLAQASGERQRDLLLRVPNLPHPGVPVGCDAAQNPVVRVEGVKPDIAKPRDHLEIAARLGLLDLDRGAKVSGSGFVCFTGAGAALERALIQFMLDLHTRKHGYLEISPPYLIRRECMVGTAQLPKFEDDMYALENGEMFLAPTAEVPVTNLHREEVLPAGDLPKKFVACTPCFRREAGSAGRETRGLIRVHQFDKVELVKIAAPQDSYDELEKLTADAEAVLQLLGLHYRIVELCTGDIGFGSAKTYDIEVWAPGQNAYLEVSSCSNFEDFQARRMNLKFKDAGGKNMFCHTLNGSGVALPRLFVALLETYCREDGSLSIPSPLQDYIRTDRLVPK